MRFILGWFGYIKVPKEAVELAMKVQQANKIVSDLMPASANAAQLYEMSKTITEFLRSGRLLQ